MHSSHKKRAAPPPSFHHPCHIRGCAAAGEFRAPRSPDHLRESNWLCMDHIREHNRNWDFFKGWSREQIEAFMQDSVTGHRPTWKTAGRVSAGSKRLQEELERFLHRFGESARRAHAPPPMPPKERKAWDTLELEAPLDEKALKKHYKTLVKRYHPDARVARNPAAEEKFKAITVAYKYLLERV